VWVTGGFPLHCLHACHRLCADRDPDHIVPSVPRCRDIHVPTHGCQSHHQHFPERQATQHCIRHEWDGPASGLCSGSGVGRHLHGHHRLKMGLLHDEHHQLLSLHCGCLVSTLDSSPFGKEMVTPVARGHRLVRSDHHERWSGLVVLRSGNHSVFLH
jgi:hypothetical protein